jgi:putative sporulation protein YyaC
MENRTNILVSELKKIVTPDTAFVCIGARKHICTIDSIGPRVGDKLFNAGIPYVYGTNADPYNGLTYEEMNKRLARDISPNTRIIAIDITSTTKKDKIGKVELIPGCIYPGSGIGRDMPPVGDYAIRAFIIGANEKHFLSDYVLKNSAEYGVKLSLVYEMTNLISGAIIKAYEESLTLPILDQLEMNSKKHKVNCLI